MPLKLDIKKELNARSERVKCVDLHPTEPWVLVCMYNGMMQIYDFQTESVVRSWEVAEEPIRCGKFIPRKQWVVCGCDDMFVRVYNYNTHEKIKTFEAHMDYIRSMSVHPTLPLLVTASDDLTIRLWDWDKGWTNTMVFEGHAHYVMQVLFNPKDPSTFASASLDHTIKVWNIRSPIPNLTLEGHEQGVNCVDYYLGADKPYLVSGGDDRAVKLWDYQTRSCVQTLELHEHNVSCVAFIHDRPLILSGSEDGTVALWNSNTYKNEATLQFNMERCWTASHVKGLNRIALGYDSGTVVIKIGKDTPLVSMDNSGKVIYIKQTEVSTVNVRSADPSLFVDGERLPLAGKELGSTENSPQSIAHSPNGRFVAVCGDGEYIIYTALAWRNKSFGEADEVVWDNAVGEYATRKGSYDVRVYSKMFKERSTIQAGFAVEGMFGGNLLTLRSNEFVCFFDWETLQLIRRIDVVPIKVYWSESDLLVVATEQSFYILQFNRSAFEAALDQTGGKVGPDGVEEAFQLLNEFTEKVTSGTWVGDCFIYTNSNNRLNNVVGSDVSLLHHLDAPSYIAGYLVKENRIILADKDANLISYRLDLALLEYKTAIIRGDIEAAKPILERVAKSEHDKLAKFLEKHGLKEEALSIATDQDYRCELAVSLGNIDLAADIARAYPSEVKWKMLSELAIQRGNIELAEECLKEINSLADLLTLGMVSSSPKVLETVTNAADENHVLNVGFLSRFMLGDASKCIDLLVSSNRIPEAALFARTYCPSEVSRIVQLWKADLRKTGQVRMADALADPEANMNLFDGFDSSLANFKKSQGMANNLRNISSDKYSTYKEQLSMGVDVEGMDTGEANGEAPAEPPAEPPVETPVEPAAEPVTEPAAEPVTEPAAEPVTEPATEPAEPAAEAPGDSPTAMKVEVPAVNGLDPKAE